MIGDLVARHGQNFVLCYGVSKAGLAVSFAPLQFCELRRFHTLRDVELCYQVLHK